MPNITVPISHPLMPPASYSATASAAPPADVRLGSFLRRLGKPAGGRRHPRDDVGQAPPVLPRLARLDEPRVLREPAGVEEQRHPEAIAERPDAAEILQRDR